MNIGSYLNLEIYFATGTFITHFVLEQQAEILPQLVEMILQLESSPTRFHHLLVAALVPSLEQLRSLLLIEPQALGCLAPAAAGPRD